MAKKTQTKQNTPPLRGMRSLLRHHRQQPRKTRLVTDAIVGKNVSEAIDILTHLNRRSSVAIKKLIQSAVSNAKTSAGLDASSLMIAEVQVGKGVTFRRFMPRARGRATPIRKRTSHISLTLSPRDTQDKTKKVKKETTQPPVHS